jgi:hypothetical protein
VALRNLVFTKIDIEGAALSGATCTQGYNVQCCVASRDSVSFTIDHFDFLTTLTVINRVVLSRHQATLASSSRLATAAEELAKAAYLDIKSESDSAAFKETVDSIAVGNAKFDGLHTVILSSKESTDAKLNSVNQHLSSLKEEVTASKQEMQLQRKIQSIEWALANLDAGPIFQIYYDRDDNNRRQTSTKELLQKILSSFRTGTGFYLPKYWSMIAENALTMNGQKSFEDKVVAHLHFLLGTKPVVKMASDGRAIVYFS